MTKFEELIQAGINAESYIIEGMPMVFEYEGGLVAFDMNTGCFLVSTHDGVETICADQ